MEAGHIKFILMDGIGKSFIDKLSQMRNCSSNPGDSDMTAVSSVSSCMHWIRGCIIILLLTILDQGSKSLVLAQLKDHPDISLIPGVLQLRYLENRGMAFGLFEGKIPVFVILCLLFLVYLSMYMPESRKTDIICRCQ